MTNAWAKLIERREVLGRMSAGIGGLALFDLVGSSGRAEAPSGYDSAPKPPHFPPKAKAVIQLFMHGGPSQMDLFDPKPMLNQYHGKPPVEQLEVASPLAAGNYLGTGAKFARHGQSGQVLSDMLPHVAGHADEIAIVRSMFTEHNNHEQALWMMHTGMIVSGRPSWGSWVAYGLGSENRNLPAYVALSDPAGLPVDGIRNWSSGWLPPTYQGTPFRSKGSPVLNLAPARPRTPRVEKGRGDLLRDLNEMHRAERADDLELEARIKTFELAARMQLSAPEALDLAQETQATRALYGLDDPVSGSYATRCLLARRLVERGVRFVQIFMAGQPWDTHADNEKLTRARCLETDRPVAALLTDLRARGLLDSTLVIWGGEFGRLPISQGGAGRDHNRNAFTIWLAGAGIKGGVCHGGTDDFGYKSVVDRVSVTDLHVTLLHLLGLDYKKLTYVHDTLEDRLTNVHEGTVVRSILA